MTDMEPRRQALPVMLLVKTALQLLWQQRDDALRLGLVPTLILFGGFLYASDALLALAAMAQSGTQDEMPAGIIGGLLTLSAAIFVGMSLLTVNWLRFLLLGPMGAVGIGLNIGWPHIRFLIAVIVLSLAMSAVLVVLSMPLVLLPAALSLIGRLLLFAAVVLVMVRLVPYFVGLAIGQPVTLAQSWKVSRGNALPLAVSLFLVQVPFMLGLYVLQHLMIGTGFATGAPVGSVFIITVVNVAASLCQAGVLATAYRHMVGVRV